jgi:hypothetical protein
MVGLRRIPVAGWTNTYAMGETSAIRATKRFVVTAAANKVPAAYATGAESECIWDYRELKTCRVPAPYRPVYGLLELELGSVRVLLTHS